MLMRRSTAPRVVEPRKIGHEYSVEHHGDKLIITTNSQGAEDFRIVEAPVAASAHGELARNHCAPARVPGARYHPLPRAHGAARARERPAAHRRAPSSRRRRARHRLPGRSLFSWHLARLRVRHHDDAFRLLVDDDAGRDLRLRYGDARTHAAQTPAGAERTQPVRLRDAPALCARRRWRDRARVDPLSPDTPLDGSAPVLLYGYGAYGISIPASFSTTRLSLVDRGFIYAIAHIRGGKDKGYHWYTDGKLAA